MRQQALLRHLRVHGCVLMREDGRHSWWHNPGLNTYSSVPRHTDIDDNLARKICKDVGIPNP